MGAGVKVLYRAYRTQVAALSKHHFLAKPSFSVLLVVHAQGGG